MADFVETTRGVIMPAQLDHLGHMNVRFYSHFFEDAAYHLWHRVGIPMNDLIAKGIGVAVVHTSIEFLQELVNGNLIVVEGAFREVGTRSATYEQRLTNVETGVQCARQRAVLVFMDMETRRAVDLPPECRAAIEANLVPEEPA